jgi:hypothetical protein
LEENNEWKNKYKLIEKYILMFGNLNMKESSKLLYHEKQIYDNVIHFMLKLDSNMAKWKILSIIEAKILFSFLFLTILQLFLTYKKRVIK